MYPIANPQGRIIDLSPYNSEELLQLWSSRNGFDDPALLCAALMDEKIFYAILARMVKEPIDAYKGDNVNWDMADLTEEVLLFVIPKTNESQAAGALLLFGWIQWVNGRMGAAKEIFQRIEATENFSPVFYRVMLQRINDSILPVVPARPS